MQQTDESSWKEEAIAFSRYLIGKEPDEQSVQLYISANKKLKVSITPKETSKIRFALHFPCTLGMIDGALALKDSEHPLRKKLYIMFSILESSPNYHQYFLPQERKRSYLLYIFFTGIRAVFNALAGLILLPWI